MMNKHETMLEIKRMIKEYSKIKGYTDFPKLLISKA